ncbi:FBD-associated F-box protein At1g66320-like [Lotus japonicus]|uniref:FBD-associated F-box protein At1g66320-like n=1 Tax=Lotus japonicus TaxID=34305 RepID=UPI00258315E7|nr:FBD-associated F-box protein At1g66320-like [Lotus japonicus]
MEDSLRSRLPEELIYHVLSKEWKSLWRSVPSLDFNDADYGTRCKAAYGRFVQSVNAFIHSRDVHQSIQKFRLRFISHDDPTSINKWVNVAVQRRVQNLDLSIMPHWLLTQPTNLYTIFTCTTLVVLKLQGLTLKELKPFSSVDLPLLKVLHLQVITLSERGCLAQFLSGCPVLEDFKAMDFIYNLHDDEGTEPYVFPKFHNLTHIELVYRCCANDWLQVVELLKQCPKLRVLVINQVHVSAIHSNGHFSEHEPDILKKDNTNFMGS